MAQINLAPQVQLMLASKRRQRRLYLFSGGIIIFAIAVYGVLFLVNTSSDAQLEDRRNQLAALKSDLSLKQADNARMHSFENRITALNELFAQRRTWDKFFKELERLVPANTVLTRMDADMDTPKVTTSGTVPSLDDVSLLIASLQDKATHSTLFSTASVREASNFSAVNDQGTVTKSGYEFSMELTKKN